MLKFINKFFKFGFQFFWFLLVILATFVLITRYFLFPLIEDSDGFLQGAMSEAIGEPVTFENVTVEWVGYRPKISMIRLAAGGKDSPLVRLNKVNATLSLRSLVERKLIFDSLEVYSPSLILVRDSSGSIQILGIPISDYPDKKDNPLAKWTLDQRQIVIRDAVVIWRDQLVGGDDVEVQGVDLRIDNDEGFHKIGLLANLNLDVAQTIVLRASFKTGSEKKFYVESGNVYLEVKSAKLTAPLLDYELALPNEMVLRQGEGNFKIWAQVKNNNITEAVFDLEAFELSLLDQKNSNHINFDSFSGIFKWRRYDQTEDFVGRNISIVHKNFTSTAPLNFNFSISDGYDYQIQFEHLQIGSFMSGLRALSINSTLKNLTQGYLLGGNLYNTTIRWFMVDDELAFRAINANFTELEIKNSERGLSGIGLDGKLKMSHDRGELVIKTQKLAFQNKIFSPPVFLERLEAIIDWKLSGKTLIAKISEGVFENTETNGSFEGLYDEENNVFELDLFLKSLDANKLFKYLPAKAKKTRKWMRESISTGLIKKTTLQWRSTATKVRKDLGISIDDLTGYGYISNAGVRYSRNWPVIEYLSGPVKLAERTISMVAETGQTSGLSIRDSSMKVYKLGSGQEYLAVAGRGSGEARSFYGFVRQSPLFKKRENIFEKISVDGIGHIGFEYLLHFRDKTKRQFRGDYKSSGKFWRLNDSLPSLESYTHTVFFDQKGVKSGSGTAQFLGSPLKYNLSRDAGGNTAINLQGGVDLGKVIPSSSILAQDLSGETSWTGILSIGDSSTQLIVQSSLEGLTSTLPDPLRKEGSESSPSILTIDWVTNMEKRIRFEISSLLKGELNRRGGDSMTGGIGLGQKLKISGDGVNLSIKLQKLDIDSWSRMLAMGDILGESEQNESEKLLLSMISSIDMSVDMLNWGGRQFNDFEIQASEGKDSWKSQIECKEADGTVLWNERTGRIVGRFDRLNVPTRFQKETSKKQGFVEKKLFPLDIVAKTFSYEGRKFGTLDLVTEPVDGILVLKNLRLNSGAGDIQITGRVDQKKEKETILDLTVEAHDVEEFLDQIGYGKGIEGGTGQLSGSISWRGPLEKIDYASLNGMIEIKVLNGQFTKLEPGAARLLGILSLQALPRRLVLDFSDIFSSGFSFKDISSNFTISDGIAYTNDFAMEGPSARVKMVGEINLEAESQKLAVEIIPQLSTAAAVAGAAVVNPAVGVATYVLQKIFGDPVEQMAAKKYLITGGWSTPSVSKMGGN